VVPVTLSAAAAIIAVVTVVVKTLVVPPGFAAKSGLVLASVEVAV
jgi:hypothetical protein